MSVSSILSTAYDVVSYGPSKAVRDLAALWNTVNKTDETAKGLSLASTFATAKGIGWNCMIIPVQGAAIAAANFYALRLLLRSFVEPETHSAKDAAVHVISFIGSSIIGYSIADSIGYAEVPHLNPGYDPRLISLTASLAGATAATVYCVYTQRKTELEKKAAQEQSFFSSITQRFM